MKRAFPQVISPFQNSFLPSRIISNNVIVAFESPHSLHKMTSGVKGFMALKLDMSEAYDRVEWVFLDYVMRKLGFCKKWVKLE